MEIEEKAEIFRSRFLQLSFGQLLTTRGEYQLLMGALSDEDIIKLKEMNVFFCRSFAPSSVTKLENIPPLDTMQLIIFEGGYLNKLLPEEIVAVILHEIGHVFFPHPELQQREFNADDFAVSRGYGKYIKSSLEKTMIADPENEINKSRLARL